MPNTPLPSRPNAPVIDRLPWLFLLLGSLLRVLWPLDIEWKFDEKWMFAKALAVASGQESWPFIGMPSGVGLQNPGLSIWPFAVLGHVFREPVSMTQAVQWINVLGLWGFALWVKKTWPAPEQALGLWGCALYAVSPLAVLFSRKIWAQDLLIVFVLPWLWGHRRRETVWGAALWGLCGALLGQVHMSGFFAAAALLAATVLTDRGRFRVGAWLAGSALGALLLLPWLQFVLSPSSPHVGSAGHFSPAFFVEAARHAWGLGLEYALGRGYRQLLKGPQVAGVATHLAGIARYGLLGLLLVAAVLRVRDGLRVHVPEPVRTYTGCVLIAGLALIALRVQMYAHYLIVFGPLVHIAAAWTVYTRRWAVLALCSLQAFISVCFLLFIHTHGGAENADFGKSYRAQTAEERALPPELAR
jgi:hypothetical protein